MATPLGLSRTIGGPSVGMPTAPAAATTTDESPVTSASRAPLIAVSSWT